MITNPYISHDTAYCENDHGHSNLEYGPSAYQPISPRPVMYPYWYSNVTPSFGSSAMNSFFRVLSALVVGLVIIAFVLFIFCLANSDRNTNKSFKTNSDIPHLYHHRVKVRPPIFKPAFKDCMDVSIVGLILGLSMGIPTTIARWYDFKTLDETVLHSKTQDQALTWKQLLESFIATPIKAINTAFNEWSWVNQTPAEVASDIAKNKLENSNITPVEPVDYWYKEMSYNPFIVWLKNKFTDPKTDKMTPSYAHALQAIKHTIVDNIEITILAVLATVIVVILTFVLSTIIRTIVSLNSSSLRTFKLLVDNL